MERNMDKSYNRNAYGVFVGHKTQFLSWFPRTGSVLLAGGQKKLIQEN